MNSQEWKKQKQTLIKQLNKQMNFLIGSVVAPRHKCGKTCQCNQGKGHIGFYLSVNKDGRTKNLYLNKQAVARARSMSQAYGEVKRLLKEISEVNYYLLREEFPSPRRIPVTPLIQRAISEENG